MKRFLPVRVLLLSAAAAVVLGIPVRLPAQPPAADEAKPEEKVAETAKPEESEGEMTDLPLQKEMEIPSVEQCLKGPVNDWLILISDRVLVVEPVDPRPGLLEAVQKRIKDARPRLPGKETAEDKAYRQSLKFVTVALPAEKEQDYRFDVDYIRSVVYFEDLMLKRIDLLLDERNVRGAFQVLLSLERRQRDWPGAAERQKRLLFVEAGVRSDAGQRESGLGLLEDLHARDKQYPELGRLAGEIVDQLVGDALIASDFRQARFDLRRLRAMDPAHRVAQARSGEMLALAREQLALAATAEREGRLDQAATHVDQAARIWPETSELNAVHRRLTARYQRVRVGVSDLPRPPSEGTRPKAPSEADRRRLPLVEVPLFRPSRMVRQMVRFDAPLLQGWEPTDLGHSLQLQMRTHRQPWESRPVISAADLALAIADRLNPHHPAYDERTATFVESVSIPSSTELLVRFHLVPLRPEAVFSFAVDLNRGGTDAGPDGPKTWPFFEHARDGSQVAYRRSVPEPESGERVERHVAEVVETRYDSIDKAIQGLQRGEVHLLPRVPAWTVKFLEDTNNYHILRYDLPETHLLHFRPDSKAIAIRELRRAMVYSLNRPQVLEDVFLRGAGEAFGRPVSGISPTTSYAYSSTVLPHKYDPAMAMSLIPAVKKQREGTLPELTLAAPSDPFIQQAVARIVDSWTRLGLKVTVVAEDSPTWDVCYRTTALAEPAAELWPALTYPRGTDVASLQTVAPWLREQLLALDQAGDFGLAETLLHRLQAQLWADVQVIPLWELQPVMAARKNIRGIPNRPMTTYDGIERWQIESWYPRD